MGWVLKTLGGAGGPWILLSLIVAFGGLASWGGIQTYRLQSCQMHHVERDRDDQKQRADTAEANAQDLRNGFELSIADLKELHSSRTRRDARLDTFTAKIEEALKDDTCAAQPLPVAVRRELCLEQGGTDCPAVPDRH